jgi:hypothetical protein
LTTDAFTRSDAGVGGGTATVAAGMDGTDAAERAGGAIASGGLGSLIGLFAHLPYRFMDPIVYAIAFMAVWGFVVRRILEPNHSCDHTRGRSQLHAPIAAKPLAGRRNPAPAGRLINMTFD